MATLDKLRNSQLWASREPFQNGWYRYAIRWFSPYDLIIDYGSGTGTGAAILREHMKGITVLEVDGDERLWKFGVKSPEILYAVHPDWIVCIDMIEHVTRGEQEALIDLFKRRVKKGFFISTPDRDQWPSNNNPFHINELSKSELEGMVGEPCERFSTDNCGEGEEHIKEGWYPGAKHIGIAWRVSK